jgi:hypothetical protein
MRTKILFVTMLLFGCDQTKPTEPYEPSPTPPAARATKPGHDDDGDDPRAGPKNAEPVCHSIGAKATFDNAGLCDRCMSGACCNDATACFDDASCASQFTCEIDCRGPGVEDEDQCLTQCETSWKRTALLRGVTACRTNKCAQYCLEE